MARGSGRIGTILQARNPAAALVRNSVASAVPTSVLMRLAGSAFAWTPPFGGDGPEAAEPAV